MISFPLYIILFVYFFFLLGFGAFFLININHLIRTGTMTLASFTVTALFLGFSAVVLLGTMYLVSDINWQHMVTLWNNNWLGSVFSSDFVVQ